VLAAQYLEAIYELAHTAIAKIEADYQRSADTHLIALPLPGFAAPRH
jgi:hypothetical protein